MYLEIAAVLLLFGFFQSLSSSSFCSQYHDSDIEECYLLSRIPMLKSFSFDCVKKPEYGVNNLANVKKVGLIAGMTCSALTFLAGMRSMKSNPHTFTESAGMKHFLI